MLRGRTTAHTTARAHAVHGAHAPRMSCATTGAYSALLSASRAAPTLPCTSLARVQPPLSVQPAWPNLHEAPECARSSIVWHDGERARATALLHRLGGRPQVTAERSRQQREHPLRRQAAAASSSSASRRQQRGDDGRQWQARPGQQQCVACMRTDCATQQAHGQLPVHVQLVVAHLGQLVAE